MHVVKCTHVCKRTCIDILIHLGSLLTNNSKKTISPSGDHYASWFGNHFSLDFLVYRAIEGEST